ncbi:glycosyltransferase family protein [Anaeromyxobacter oryzae]|uniref:Glycosyl transferase group 1 n=1 Tax=Anaeromyxobacter oryzae TaxID=2918170 RepID=A0ABN6MT64_9BACT|nr:hypothetical protein [Anaeromyxobacter oryzae]BDG03082.1 hypothetical protein AMOR_20780 [Anaeromyxobacter oryzae]
MPDPLHILEPTLVDEAGHCRSFTESLCAAARGHPVTLWVGRGARLSSLPSEVRVEPHFHRRLRRVQALLLMRRLLRAPGRIFVATAGRVDFVLLDLAARGLEIPPAKVFLYVHWYRDTAARRRTLARIARRRPELVVLGPTEDIVDRLRACGFQRAQVVPYPITPAAPDRAGAPVPFAHVLFAGAARQDKGFRSVVDLVEHLARSDAAVPVVVQSSSEQHDRHDHATRAELERLRALPYPALTLLPETLPAERYGALFAGGICLQPYDVREFANRVSGVTLDALSRGCPIVAVRGTWTARIVDRFGAGVVVDDTTPETLHGAVRAVIDRYPEFQARARRGGASLQEENDSRRLFDVLTA